MVPAIAAWLFYQLPYFSADIDCKESGGEYAFELWRTLSTAARFRARWRRGARLRDPDVESLAFFLVERYGFFVKSGEGLSLTRAYHHSRILDEAILESCESTLLASLGLPEPVDEPLVHCSEGQKAEVWPPQEA